MIARSQARATYADIEAAPPHVIAEIIEGELSTRRFFGPRDGYSLAQLHHRLASQMNRPHAASAPTVMLRPEVHFDGNVLVPELAMWRQGDVWNFEDWRDFKALPKWVLEWITPWTDVDRHQQRCRIYAAAGIPALWRLDSVTRSLQTFALDGGAQWQLQSTYTARDRFRAEPFPEIEIDLADLWHEPWSPAPASSAPSETPSDE